MLGRMPAFARPIVVTTGRRTAPPTSPPPRRPRRPRPRRGYGAACHAGLEAPPPTSSPSWKRTRASTRAELERLVEVVDGGADLAVGSRRGAGRDAWPWHLRLANRVVAARLRRRTGLRLDDIGPMRLGGRQALLDLGVVDRRSGYPLETLVRAADAGGGPPGRRLVPPPRRALKVTGTPLGAARAVRDMSKVLAS